MTQSFKDLITWQKAHEFVLLVYKFTNAFPSHERFGLMSQFQRAAVSIAANIAEGYKKTGKSDKLRLMNVAQGSLEECRYYILLSKDLKYITEEISLILTERIENVSRLLNAHCKAVQNSKFTGIIEDS